MGKSKPTHSIGAAECARRTGLTVRALRVYERCGLIAPARSANGYRLYSRKDLVRLNAIVTLKSVGLTLAQIREVLSGSPPALRRILHLQLEALQKRRTAAEEGIGLVRAAIARLDSRARVSILELCELARSMDMGNLQETTREVINESIGAEEERAWLTWWARRPQQEVTSMQQYAASQREVMAELAKLQGAGAEVGSAEVQAQVGQFMTNLQRYGVRRPMVEALAWNATLTRKWMDIGARVTSRALASQQLGQSGDVWVFFRSAAKASPMGRSIAALLDDARAAAAAGVSPESPPAAALAQRLEDLCREAELGDPLIFARWTSAMGTWSAAGQLVDWNAAEDSGWKLLIAALASRQSHPT